MTKLLILAAAALATASAPVLAKAGKGKGRPPGHVPTAQIPVVPGSPTGYGVGGCPPGLADKGCIPPGQAKKLFGVGQRVPDGYRGLLGYNALPYELRSRLGPQLDPRSRYIYDNSYLYRVDPATMVVQQVLGAVLRP